jgi:hypothetical protein
LVKFIKEVFQLGAFHSYSLVSKSYFYMTREESYFGIRLEKV